MGSHVNVDIADLFYIKNNLVSYLSFWFTIKRLLAIFLVSTNDDPSQAVTSFSIDKGLTFVKTLLSFDCQVLCHPNRTGRKHYKSLCNNNIVVPPSLHYPRRGFSPQNYFGNLVCDSHEYREITRPTEQSHHISRLALNTTGHRSGLNNLEPCIHRHDRFHRGSVCFKVVLTTS